MPVAQQHNPGQLQDVLLILRRRTWQFLIPTAFGLSIGCFMAAIMPRRYDVQTQVQMHEISLPLGGRNFEATALARDLQNAPPEIKSPERVRKVIEKQEWEDYAGLSRDAQREYLARVIAAIQVNATVSKTYTGSQFLIIKYRDSDPQRAARFVNDLRQDYVNDKIDYARSKAKEEKDKLQELRQEKEKLYSDSESKLIELKRKNRLSVTQPTPGKGVVRPEDPLFTERDDTRMDLNKAQAALDIELANNKSLKELYEHEPPEVRQEFSEQGVDVNARLAEIDSGIADLKRDQQEYRPAHSKWGIIQDKIELALQQRRILQGQEVDPLVELKFVPNQRKNQIFTQLQDSDVKIRTLRATIATMEDRFEKLQEECDRLIDVYRDQQTLSQEVDQAQVSFGNADETYQRQKDFYEFISGPPGNPFEVIERAEPPRTPSSPIVPLIIVLYGLAGLGLGILSSALSEFGRNAFRTSGDVSRSMSVPVLGTTHRIVTRSQNRSLIQRRLVVAVASTVLIGGVLWVTWAWSNKKRVLAPQLVEVIDELRESLR